MSTTAAPTATSDAETQRAATQQWLRDIIAAKPESRRDVAGICAGSEWDLPASYLVREHWNGRSQYVDARSAQLLAAAALLGAPTNADRLAAQKILKAGYQERLAVAHSSDRKTMAEGFASDEWANGVANKDGFTSRENYISGRSMELLGLAVVYDPGSAVVKQYTADDFNR